MPTTTRRAGRAVATLLAAATALSACGSDTLDVGDTAAAGGGSDATAAARSAIDSVKTDPELVKLVPEKITAAGTLAIGTEASYAPMEFVGADGATVVGVDADLIDAVAKKLGVRAVRQQTEFASIIMGVTGGKYDVGASSFTINADREKQVLMVSYFKAGTLWAVQKGNPKKIDPADVCGLTVGVQKGTVQLDELNARSKKCLAEGKPAVNIVVENGQSKVTADLVSGKVAAFTADSPVTAYAITLQGDFIERLGEMYDSAPYGFVVRKSEPRLAQAIATALTDLKAEGVYDAVLKKWNVDDGGVDRFEINPEVAS